MFKTNSAKRKRSTRRNLTETIEIFSINRFRTEEYRKEKVQFIEQIEKIESELREQLQTSQVS